MNDITALWERLYVGGKDDAEHLAKSNPHGIETVVSLCDVPVVRRNPTINYLHIPIEDERPVCVGQFDAVMDAIIENIRWGKVLVHCGLGISRAPIMTAAYMDAVGYLNIDAALAEIRFHQSIDSLAEQCEGAFEMKKAAIYARVSTPEQHIESQLYDLRHLATHGGWKS
ncbi:MAG TPA: dual specificity protein phosphatase family protein [Terriglobales bacterium]|nr:dual specificity protein phosphatase family protein [Terriglobales bacterium]